MIQQLIREKKGTIIDVRTPTEFMGGNAVDSINIPLQELPSRVDEIIYYAVRLAVEADKHTITLVS